MLPWIEAVPVVIVAPTVLEVVEVDAVEGKHKIALYMYKSTTHITQKYKSDKHALDYTTTNFFYFYFCNPSVPHCGNSL